MALVAQGLAAPRPSGRVDLRHLHRVFARVGAVQIDPINVVERAHYLTLYSRLGPYERRLLWRAYHERRELMEYWAHAACFLPVEDYPLFRHRMEAARPWREVQHLERERPGYLEAVFEEVRRRGPLAADELEDPGERHTPYWSTGWTTGKLALEWLFVTGRLVVGERRGLVRRYDLPERVIPREYLAAPAPSRAEAQRRLLLRAAGSLGVGTAADLAGYYMIPIKEARPAVEALAAEGRLERAAVEGWREPAYRHPEAEAPRRVRAAALLCPFDSLIWDRRRTARLFGFDYRAEIYTPAAQRTWGYYVLPFLLGEHLAARVDLKADRARRVLRVPGAFLEAGGDAATVVPALAVELELMAGWLGLEGVEVGERGDLSGPLRRAQSGRGFR
ncbi:MAG: YcaQ family DNA glycosylase [Acidimicrobiia bacterium]|nr:YcaQ family DNA glycosylase [Acidimicrobiia bacterium]